MIVGFDESSLVQWKQDLQMYETLKKTHPSNLPSSYQPHSAHSQKRQQILNRQDSKGLQLWQQKKQREANQVRKWDEQQSRKREYALNKYLGQKYQHAQKYDIINLSEVHSATEIGSHAHHNPTPIRTPYNLINGQPLPAFYIQNRPLLIPNQRQAMKFNQAQGREYNILSGQEKSEEQSKSRMKERDQQVREKWEKGHVYNKIFGRLYSDEAEQHYQQQKHKQEEKRAEYLLNNPSLPPTYLNREPFLPDLSKPLPQSVQQRDLKQSLAKQRYRLKYHLEEQYRKVGEDMDKKKEEGTMGRFAKYQKQPIKPYDFVGSNTHTHLKTVEAMPDKTIKSGGFK